MTKQIQELLQEGDRCWTKDCLESENDKLKSLDDESVDLDLLLARDLVGVMITSSRELPKRAAGSGHTRQRLSKLHCQCRCKPATMSGCLADTANVAYVAVPRDLRAKLWRR